MPEALTDMALSLTAFQGTDSGMSVSAHSDLPIQLQRNIFACKALRLT